MRAGHYLGEEIQRVDAPSSRKRIENTLRREWLMQDLRAERLQASLAAPNTAPIAPINPASPVPLAPSCVEVSRVST